MTPTILKIIEITLILAMIIFVVLTMRKYVMVQKCRILSETDDTPEIREECLKAIIYAFLAVLSGGLCVLIEYIKNGNIIYL